MKRYRSLLPILILIAIGIALLASGVLNRFRPENLAHEQATLQIQIALHAWLACAIHIGAVTLAISTGIPGVVVLILAGGMLFGVWLGTLLSAIGVTLGALILFLASRHAFGSHRGVDAPGLVGRLRSGYLAHPVSYTFFCASFLSSRSVASPSAWPGCAVRCGCSSSPPLVVVQ